MCFSSLVLSRRPNIFKKRPQTLKNPLTPIGSGRDLHIITLECLKRVTSIFFCHALNLPHALALHTK